VQNKVMVQGILTRCFLATGTNSLGLATVSSSSTPSRLVMALLNDSLISMKGKTGLANLKIWLGKQRNVAEASELKIGDGGGENWPWKCSTGP
jgi:hypothetical protein